MDNVKTLWSSYLLWVSEHPELATNIETSIKWISYLATGYLRNSENSLLWSEMVYSASDLLKFVNDRAHEQAFKAASCVSYERIEHFLAFLDSAEVLLEIGASMAGGPTAKWIAISVIQTLKCTWRAIYVLKKKNLVTRPLVRPINRDELLKCNAEVIPLTRSGRTMMRSNLVMKSGAYSRTWRTSNPMVKTKLDQQQIMAELAFVLQPLVHLSTLGIFGSQSWLPWIFSASCDILSNGLHWDTSRLTPDEKLEIWKRRREMVIYLLRSPLYDLHTKRLFVGIFLLAKPKIPFARSISDFLMSYVPHYRRIYACLWSK